MTDQESQISNAFQTFMAGAPAHAQTWGIVVRELSRCQRAGRQNERIGLPGCVGRITFESSVPFHVKAAKALGASREQVISAILVGLAAAGHVVTQVPPAAAAAYDAQWQTST